MKKSLKLIDDLIVASQIEDKERQKARANKETKVYGIDIGESFMTFHLKALKDLVISEYNETVLALPSKQ